MYSTEELANDGADQIHLALKSGSAHGKIGSRQ